MRAKKPSAKKPDKGPEPQRGLMTRKYFGTDGIRGRANGVITAELALKVGQAAGLTFQNGDHRHRVLIGKDTRLSGYMIENALTAGFTSVGMDVLLTGPIPTPGGRHADALDARRPRRHDLGLAQSVRRQRHQAVRPGRLQAVRRDREADRGADRLPTSASGSPTSQKIGRAKRIDGVQDRYIEFAKRTLPRAMELDGMRVVVDCANGAAYRSRPPRCGSSAPRCSRSASSRTASTSTRMCGSTAPEALVRKVREMRADIGIALDGDADRVVIVDEKGHLVDGDQLLAVVAESWMEDRRLAKPTVVATVMSNLGFERHLKGLGLTLARTPVGDRYVLEHMREGGFNLGGEPSGHIIMSDYATTGDGFVAALQVLAVVKKHGRPVSEVCHRFEPLPQVMKNVRYRDGKPLEDAKVKSRDRGTRCSGSTGRAGW